MTITENSTAKFLKGEATEDGAGGCIFSDHGFSLTFNGNSVIIFCRNKVTQGRVIYSCNNSGVVLDKNTQVWFNYSTAVKLGRALYIEKNSYIITKGTSAFTLCNGMAINRSGIIVTLTAVYRLKEILQ